MKKFYKINKNILQIFYVRIYFNQLIAYLTTNFFNGLYKGPELNK